MGHRRTGANFHGVSGFCSTAIRAGPFFIRHNSGQSTVSCSHDKLQQKSGGTALVFHFSLDHVDTGLQVATDTGVRGFLPC